MCLVLHLGDSDVILGANGENTKLNESENNPKLMKVGGKNKVF